MHEYKIALAGNPNVGKSTVFNALTGLKQHTGNWTGKTVECAEGRFLCGGCGFSVTDLPGTYSLSAFSREEDVTARYLSQKACDCVVVVLDAGVLERNLFLALQVLSLHENAVICLNLMDEAAQKGLKIDSTQLSKLLGVPVVECCAAKKHGIDALKAAVLKACSSPPQPNGFYRRFDLESGNVEALVRGWCRTIAEACVQQAAVDRKTKRDRRLDRLFTSKATGIPLMLLLCGLLFWLTAVGANYPSQWLSLLFEVIKEEFYRWSEILSAPDFLSGIIIDGIYTTLSWVVSVMLPPMAIFFPLFFFFFDAGYLPRIAFNLDRFFSCCGAHGKQSLCMMMGIGCNACGVTGCRIIENKKERLIAVLTNNFMPCNGRLPILIALILIFFAGSSLSLVSSVKVAAILLAILVGCVSVTLLFSKLLSKLLSDDAPSGFMLELPPYRKPQLLKTLTRSFLDRTLRVLGRAAAVAAPAGAVIWLCANIKIGDCSVLRHCTDALDPFGRFIGLDGVIVMALLLGFPANETVIPIIVMAYTANGTLTDFTNYEQLFQLLTQNGWTTTTAVCMMIMTVMHFPCSTTCLTIRKETGSWKWTLLAMLIPTLSGMTVCAIVSHILGIWA